MDVESWWGIVGVVVEVFLWLLVPCVWNWVLLLLLLLLFLFLFWRSNVGFHIAWVRLLCYGVHSGLEPRWLRR